MGLQQIPKNVIYPTIMLAYWFISDNSVLRVYT